MQIRLPAEVKNWLVEQAVENASSQSCEVVRSLRERMRLQNKPAATAAALQAAYQSPSSED